MSVEVTVTMKQGSTMGTVIAKVTDPGVLVRDVYFYIAVPGRSPELGPYPPDIVRRPSPGVYEKDVVLDPEFETIVRTVVFKHDGTEVTGIAEKKFDPRTGTAGGTGEVRVQDADTAATVAGTLAFQGTVVSVANGVATFNLDSRYVARDGVGAIVAQGIQANRDSSPSSGGVALYPIPGAPDTFGIFLRGATQGSAWGHHGYVTGDWNVYHNIDNSPGRGWVFRNSATGNVASIRNDGSATFGFVRSPGGARVGPHLDVGVGTHASSIRRPDGGPMYLQSGGGGFVVVGDPLLTAYKFSVLGDVYAEGGWLRTNGTRGWYNETHGGGVTMEDATWVRVYGGKGFLVPGNIKTLGAFYGSGAAVRLSSDDSYWYATSSSGMQFYGIDGGRKGYVYHDSAGFGLLHGGGGWAVRTWNGGTMLYGDVQVETRLNLTDGNASHQGTSKRIYFGETSDAYAIFKSASWPSSGGGHSRLVINYHTGIVMGAQQEYGGIQFFGKELGAGGAKLFSVGEGDENVRVANVLHVGGKVAAVAGYTAGGTRWLDSTAHGSSLHGTHDFVFTRSGSGVIVQDQAGNTQGYVRYAGGSFGLQDAGGTWRVRTHGSGVQLHGSSLTDGDGNQLAAIKAVTDAPGPGTAGRVGTIYVLVA